MPGQEFNAAVTGVAQYFELRKQGKVAEAERQRQRTMTMIDTATKAMGMGVQREQLRLSRLAGQRAEQLLPSQIRTAEAGARLSEAQAGGLELQQQRQKDVQSAVDSFLKEQGLTQLPADALPVVLDAVRGVADISQVQEAIRLGAPEAKARVEAGELTEREQVQEERQILGAPREEAASKHQQFVRDRLTAMQDIQMLEEREQRYIAETDYIISRAEELGLRGRVADLKLQRVQTFKDMLIQKGMNPDEVEFQMGMVEAGFWDNPDELRDKIRALDVVIAQVNQKNTFQEVKAAAKQQGGAMAIPDDDMAWVSAMLSTQGVTGGITPENKRMALSILTKSRNAILQSAQKRFSYEDFTTVTTQGEGWQQLPHGEGLPVEKRLGPTRLELEGVRPLREDTGERSSPTEPQILPD
jgi:hypothetical protein